MNLSTFVLFGNGAIFCGENRSGTGVLQHMASTLVLLSLGTVDGKLKILQNRSKNCFSWLLRQKDYNIPVMPTLPLLAGDLRFFASSPALLLWYINLPLFTCTINIEYLVKNKTDLV